MKQTCQFFSDVHINTLLCKQLPVCRQLVTVSGRCDTVEVDLWSCVLGHCATVLLVSLV